jgi:hypothetical protein
MVTQPHLKRPSPMPIVTIVAVYGNGNGKNGLLRWPKCNDPTENSYFQQGLTNELGPMVTVFREPVIPASGGREER